ncbi:MAG: hypothetical protein BHW17_05815 [Dorea sp. 42_8]|nr:MAG: hypothetical protein BHW17_05815 [Dorea sp. 42_8]
MKVRSIRSKVLISIVGITLLTSAALAFVFYGRSAAMIEENYVTVLSQRTRLLADTIDDMMKNVCSIDMKASCDSEVKASLESYLKDGDEKRLSDLSTRLRIFAKMDQAISSVYLVIPDKRQVVTTMDYPVYKSGIEEEKIQQFLKKCGKDTGPVIMEDLVHNQEKLLQFIEEVTDTQGNVMGYVCTNIEEENLSYDYLEDPANQELDQMELIGNGKIIAARGLSQMGKDFPEKIYGKWTNHSEITGAGKETIYIYCEGSFSRCGIFASVKRSVILSNLMQVRKYVFGVAAILSLVAVIAAVYISRIVYRPVRKLMVAMQEVSAGEMATRAEVVSNDEIGLAAKEFNRMLDRIEELIKQLIAEEKKKKDAELEALQYQITPHFMYNTLNSIKCYALIHGQKEIATVIEDFVELLQTCIRKKGAFLTVAEEVQILENYIHLQEFRNGEAYQTEYKIEREAEQCKIPRLLLQPLVENAIIHGLDIKKQKKRLLIEAYTSGSRLYLEVKDNGRGMSEEQIEELLKKKEKKTKGLTAVGIQNIQDRLKLYYGKQAKLSLESDEKGMKNHEKSIIGRR